MTTLEITEPTPVDFVEAAQMQDVAFALTNWATLTPSVLCGWCAAPMIPRSAGEPCLSCQEELRRQDWLEEAACDYAATHGRGRDYILMQDGGID